MKLNFSKLLILSVVLNLCLANNGMDKVKRSLVIIFDVTGSMSEEINALRKGVLSLLDSFNSQPDNPIANYIFIQFGDETSEPNIIPPIVESSYSRIVQHLNSFSISSGRNWDCPESCFRGIKRGLDLADDKSIVFVFTDAGTKHKELEPEILRLIQRKRITIYFFLTKGCDVVNFGDDYRRLARSSNGLVFDVDHTEIEKHFSQYRKVINDKLAIHQQVTGSPGKSKVNVEVDSSMKKFTLTIVAQRPAINIYDPHNKQVTYEVLTDLQTIKMIEVKDPIPGKWTIQVETTTPYTGQVTVISDLSFKYGFAVHKPNTIAETSVYPLIGQNSYLAISPSNSSLIRNLEYVVLDTTSKVHQFKLRKEKVADGDLYITEPIELPKDPFKVVLHGIDPANHALKRLLSPDIEPQQPGKPEAAIVKKISVKEGEPIYLICRVESLIDITISWWKVGQSLVLNTLRSKQSNTLNHTIAESEISDAGEYSCIAKNSAGESALTTIVEVHHTVLNVNAPIKHHFPMSGDRLELKCVVKPKIAEVEISWLFNGKTVLPHGTEANLPNLVLNNIDRNFNGTYTCVAKRNSEIQQDIIEVNVQYKPEILNIFNHDSSDVIDASNAIEIFDQSLMNISCGFEGNPEPEVKWINQNGDTVSSTSILFVDGKDIKHSGDYACQAENSAGKDEKHINVVITNKPKLVEPFDRDFRVKLGDEFSLECPIQVVPNTKVEIVWYHNTSRIQQDSILNDRVTIDKTDHVHNGKYKCEASNKAGAVEAEFNVNVLYQPKILNIVKLDDTGSDILATSVTKIETFNITKFSLTCNANGNPPPAITWKKESIIFSDTNKLDINLTQTGFSGLYTCSIENELSTDYRVIELFEIGKPKLSPNFKSNHREKQGGQLSLDCPIQVDPNSKPDIVWYHNTSRIHPSLVVNDHVKINKLDHVHNGKYRCEASTKAGTVVAEFNVGVLYPPKIVNIEKIDDFGSKILKPSITKLEIFNVTKFSLTCIVIGNPPPVTVWKKNGVIFSRTNKLNINLAQTGFSGLYSCSIENELSSDDRVIELFEIGKPKISPNFKSNHREKLGGQLSLDCPIQVDPNSKPDIVWYHNTSRIQPSLVVNDRVKINKLDHVHNGKYRCEASTKAGTVVAEFNVDVLYPPKIVNIEKIDDFGSKILKPSITKLEIFNVTKFSLTCIVIGNPPPVTVWKKNGVIFSRTNKLNLNLAQTGFSGLYSCFIENELSSDDRVIELVEIIKPKLSRYSNVQNLVENNEFRMICPVEPGDYDVKWFFNDNSIDQYKQADGSLLIKNVDTNMKGRAYCVATNKAGSVVASFNFDVLQPPYGLSTTTSSYKNRLHQIAPNKKQMTLVKDAPFDITCNAQGNPNPDIYWLKNDQMYFKGKLITISSVQSNDAATYTCIAENTLGNQTENISVIINVPPYLLNTSGLENSANTNNVNKIGVTVLNRVTVPDTYFKAEYEQIIQINEGEKVSLECKMDGHPKPIINWYKNNENLNKQTAVLEFTSARIENSGIYKCVGDNTSGKEMSVIFYLNVQKPISIISATSTKPVYEVGDEIKLICKTKGNQLPLIVWRKIHFTDNEIIFKSNDSIRKQLLQQDEPLYLNNTNIIQVSNMASLEHYGKLSYEFIDGEYTVKSVKIEVVAAPSLEIAEEEYSILEGINVHKIKCPITGVPSPLIEWYRENSKLTSNQNFDVQNHFLEFKSPMLHHAGEYSCRGTNNGGSVEFKFKVIIFKHEADISNVVLNLSPKRGLEVEKYKSKLVECSIKATPTYWSRIIDAYPIKQRIFLAATETYTFYGNVSTDIICSKDAEPEYGEIIQITVIEKPTIQSIETNIEVKLDDNLRLQCDATGEPKPTIKWYKYERGQQYDIDNYSGFVANDESLIKWRAENSDTTLYVCTAQNKLGEVSHTFNVTVLTDSHYFSSWSGWSTCTKTCGEGVQLRTRDCIHASCTQPQQREERICTTIACPVNGGWSDFSKYGPCSKSCVIDYADISTKQSKRECNKPAPAFGGQQCKGNSVRILNCTVPLCISVENTLVYPSACLDQPICCPIGYVHDNRTGGCKEIDKCKRKGPYSACKSETQKCVNIGIDDYKCECKPGFTLKRRGKYNPKKPNCVDIDECRSESKPCGTLKCDNTVGSYKCINSII